MIYYGRGGEILTNRRGLASLFWQHVRLYGEVRLALGARLDIGPRAAAEEVR